MGKWYGLYILRDIIFSSHKICNAFLMLRLSKGWLKVDWYEYPPRAYVMFHSNLSFSHCVVYM